MIRIVCGLCFFMLVAIAYVSHLCRNSMCLSHEHAPGWRAASGVRKVEAVPDVKIELVPFREASPDGFDILGRDVMVFLHVQKTGGTTFGRHLVRDLNLDSPCACPRKRKRCDCFRPNTLNEQWLFSRYSTGWRCGLHADWTELTGCVEDALDEYENYPKKRRYPLNKNNYHPFQTLTTPRYFFITVLRDPIHRYLSEFRHVQRGATWKSARHWCGGKEFTTLPHCYKVLDHFKVHWFTLTV